MYRFTEEQEMIRDMVREFTENEVEPRDAWMDENGFDRTVYEKLCETELLGIHIAEEYGGGGGDAVSSQIVINELARGSASVALYVDATWLAADMILEHGSKAQRDTYLPLAAKGRLFAFGLTEAGAGSDAANIQSTAVKCDDGGYLLNGGKAWITNSGVADYYLIAAKTDPLAGSGGISAFIVPADAQGLTIGRPENKMGMRGSMTCELSFDRIRLPAEALVGQEGDGFKIAMRALDGARISIGSIASGLARHAMEIARAYANECRTFGRPIRTYQGISFKFADMAAKIRAMEAMLWDTAQMKAAGQKHTLEAAELKLLASGWCKEICDDCIQILGGNGYSREFHVERLYRDAKLLEIGEGSSEILRIVISSAVFA